MKGFILQISGFFWSKTAGFSQAEANYAEKWPV
jgi:hypothetical protein